MGVEVLWQGRCSDYYVQQKLVERMIELDDVITAAHLKQADKEKSRILFRPENAVNKVMVSGSLFSDQNCLNHSNKLMGAISWLMRSDCLGLHFRSLKPIRRLMNQIRALPTK